MPNVSLGTVERIAHEETGLLAQQMQDPAATAAAIERRVNAAIADEAASRRGRPFAGSAAFWLLAVLAAAAGVWTTGAWRVLARQAARPSMSG